MKVLVVYAHPKPQSFNHAVLEAFTKGLTERGHEFEVVDLYSIRFDPCMRAEDFAQFTGGDMPDDVQEQQTKVARAEALAFITPIWWMGFPAILKGWGERVFSYGFAYTLTDSGWKGDAQGRVGLLEHKKVLIVSTTFFSETDYKSTGLKDAMEKTIEEWAFKKPGIPQVEHVYFYGVHGSSDETRKGYLNTAHRLGMEF